MKTTKLLLASLLFAGSFVAAQADVLAKWDFEGASGTTGFAANSSLTATGLTVGTMNEYFANVKAGATLAKANALNPAILSTPSKNTPASGSLTPTGQFLEIGMVATSEGTNTTLSNDALNGYYMKFDIKAQENNNLSISSVSFDFGGDNAASAGSIMTKLFFALDTGGTITWTQIGSHTLTTTLANGYFIENVSFSTVSIAALQDLDSTTKVLFALGFGDGSGSDTRRHMLDNLQINGTVSPIPEPGTYAAVLGALALFALALRRWSKG